jgi:hypothetical protein
LDIRIICAHLAWGWGGAKKRDRQGGDQGIHPKLVRSDHISSLSLTKAINLLSRRKLVEVVVLPLKYLVEGNSEAKNG